MSAVRAPAWLRHLAGVWAAVAAGTVTSAVIAAHGVTGVDWPDTLTAAVDEGAVAVAVAVAVAGAALWLTPLTRAYGVGAPAGAARLTVGRRMARCEIIRRSARLPTHADEGGPRQGHPRSRLPP